MDVSGVNLDWFFDEWIYRSGTPVYGLSYTAQPGMTTFYLQQLQRTDSLVHYFRMPIVFEVHYTDGSRDTFRAMTAHQYDTVSVPNASGKKIAYTLFDPGYNVMKTVKFNRSYDELKAQAAQATNMIDRYEALLALRDTALDRKRNDFKALFDTEKFYGIRAEIVNQLRFDADEADAVPFFRKALHDENFNVRRSAVDNLDTIIPSLLSDFERLINDTSYYTIETALRKLVRQYPQNKDRYLATVSKLHGISQNVRIAYLELRWDANISAERKELVDYTSQSYEFRTRVRAMEALDRLDYCNADLIKYLTDAIINPNIRLAGPATKTLKKMMQKAEVKDMANAYYKSMQWQDWQQEKLKSIFESGK
jgi:aminopeptidase N